MRPDQIARYLELADRHTRGAFYMKAWRSWTNPMDRVTLREAAYLVGAETPDSGGRRRRQCVEHLKDVVVPACVTGRRPFDR